MAKPTNCINYYVDYRCIKGEMTYYVFAILTNEPVFSAGTYQAALAHCKKLNGCK